MIKRNTINNQSILFDRECLEDASADLFDPDWIEQNAESLGRSSGRGYAIFYRLNKLDLVLRHYQRGGLVAKLVHDFYFGLRIVSSRAWKEWYLLHEMYNLGLPVPRPVAARVVRTGLWYRADLVTEYIPGSLTLASYLQNQVLSAKQWKQIGCVIKRFHHKQIYHADLNAKNILLDSNDRIYLIDFDRGRISKGDAWKKQNLERLQRSLNKFKKKNAGFSFTHDDWEKLLQGYESC